MKKLPSSFDELKEYVFQKWGITGQIVLLGFCLIVIIIYFWKDIIQHPLIVDMNDSGNISNQNYMESQGNNLLDKFEEKIRENIILEENSFRIKNENKLLRNAIKQLTENLKNYPGSQEAFDELTKKGNPEKAKTIIQKFAKEWESAGGKAFRMAAQARRNLGQLSIKSNPQAALPEYQKAVMLDPENPDGWSQLCYVQTQIQDYGEAEKSCRFFLDLGIAAQKKVAQATAYYQLGNIFEAQQDLEQAKGNYKIALDLWSKIGNIWQQAQCFLKLGYINKRQNNIVQSVSNLEKALRLFKELQLFLGQSVIHSNLGNLYLKQGELGKAEDQFRDSLDVLTSKKPAKYELVLPYIYMSLANLFQRKNQLGKAEKYLQIGKTLFEEQGNKNFQAFAFSNLGLLSIKQNKLKQAEDYFQKGLELFQDTGEKVEEARMLINLGKLSNKLENFESARSYLQQSLTLCTQSKNRACEANSHHGIADTFWKDAKYKQAIEHYKSSMNLYKDIGEETQYLEIKNFLNSRPSYISDK